MNSKRQNEDKFGHAVYKLGLPFVVEAYTLRCLFNKEFYFEFLLLLHLIEIPRSQALCQIFGPFFGRFFYDGQ